MTKDILKRPYLWLKIDGEWQALTASEYAMYLMSR